MSQTDSHSPRKKGLLGRVVMVVVSLALFGYIGFTVDWAHTWSAIRQASIFWILVYSLIMMMAHFIRGWRWNMLTEPVGYTLNKRRSFYAVMTGYLVNVATSRGGEVARCAMASKSEKAPVEMLIGTVVTERIIDMLVMGSLSLLCLVWEYEAISDFFLGPVVGAWHWAANHPLALVLALGAAVAIFLLWRRRSSTQSSSTDSFLSRFSGGLKSIFKLRNPGLFILSSYAIWIGYWLCMYVTLKALPMTAEFTLSQSLAVMVFSAFGIIVPVPAGAGVWGVVAYGLHMVYGLELATAETFGIFTVALSNLLLIVGGSVCYAAWLWESRTDRA
jgi:uncharacterized protein (TIRG00374 family)